MSHKDKTFFEKIMTTPCKSNSEPEWRSKSLNERLAYAYTNKLFTDVTIGVCLGGKENIFMGHKNILASFSSVLEQQFYGNECQDLTYIKLEGIDPQGLAYVLKLLYHIPPSPRKDVDRSILLSAYHAAKTLGMQNFEADLKREILDQILTPSLMTRDDFWKILELSRILKLNDITDRILRLAESNGKIILRAKSLTKVSPTTLREVLDLDMLKISEKDVLDCIVRWKEENLELPFVEEFLMDLLRCVRFRNLSSFDLCQFVATKNDLISSDDVLGIMMHLGNPTSRPLPTWCSTKFRCSITSLTKDALIDHKVEMSPKVPINSKELSFKITRRGHSGLLNMYFEQKYPDVCFLVGNERKQMKAHRNILAIGSIIFEKMFFAPLPDLRYEIEVPKEDQEGFDKMLMYFYDDSNPDSLFKKPDVAVKTFDVALKYGSMNLKNVCLKNYTPAKTQTKTFWKQLELMIKQPSRNDKSLKQLLDYAAKNTRDILSSPGFLNATLDAVRCVLKLDTLSVEEVEVLNYVVRWLEQNSKFSKSEKSRYDLLSLVRFSNITSEDFCSFSAQHSDILPKNQLFSILIHLQNRGLPLPDWCHKGPPRKLADMLLPYDKYPYEYPNNFSVPTSMKSEILLGMIK